MNKLLISALVLAATATGAAAEPIGYPGVTWNTIVFSEKRTDQPTAQMQGIIEQGVDWTRIADWKFNTYAAVTYSIDNNHSTAYTPQIGAKFNRRYDNGSLDLGVRLMDNHSQNTSNSNLPGSAIVKTGKGLTLQAYSTFWFEWNLKK